MGIFGLFRQPTDGPDRADLRSLEADIAALRSQHTLLHERLEVLTNELATVADSVRTQTVAIAEGIERVDRSERRVRAVVTRAQQRLADAGYQDEGLEAEAAQLQPLNADGGGVEGMQYVHEGLARDDPPFDAQGIPGDLSAEILNRSGL